MQSAHDAEILLPKRTDQKDSWNELFFKDKELS
jgi:hypothetical protein